MPSISKRRGTTPRSSHDAPAALSLIDEHGGREGAHGASRLCRLASRQRRLGAAHRADAQDRVRDLHTLYPERIVNKTNGITFRRWLQQANPGLTPMLVRTICGDGVLDDPDSSRGLASHAGDPSLHELIERREARNKIALARVIAQPHGPAASIAHALFDVHIKRIHEYKRQLLNLLETVALYHAIRAEAERRLGAAGEDLRRQGGRELSAGQADHQAGQRHRRRRSTTIRSRATCCASCSCRITMSVSPRSIIPAADLSEQISTAGMEASGTGNMKLALNGALTIGTLDGANIEIREHVGDENIFIFGLEADEVEERRRQGLDAGASIAACPELADVLAAIETGVFSPDEPHRFLGLTHALRYSDYYMVLADFAAYFQTQRRIDELYLSRGRWTTTSILNIAHMSWFSSDRAIREYATEIWNVSYQPVGKTRELTGP